MASKLLPDLINQTDIEEYLNDFADFSFELRVLKELIDLHHQCQHGGTYDDPITGKSREFDIRALFEDEEVLRIHLSVECKNLQPNFPLVMHSLRRKENESYNELIHSFDNSEKYGPDTSPMALLERLEHSKTIRVTRNTLYSKDAYV